MDRMTQDFIKSCALIVAVVSACNWIIYKAAEAML